MRVYNCLLVTTNVSCILRIWRVDLLTLQCNNIHMSEDKNKEQDAVQVNDDLDALGIEGLARDKAVGWFKFDSVGDAIGGTVRDMFFQPEQDGMGAQRVFSIERENKQIWNVGLKWNRHTQTRTDQVQIGDKLGLKFMKEIPATRKGFNPAKSIGKYPEFIGERIVSKSAAALAGPESVSNPVDSDWDEIPENEKVTKTETEAPASKQEKSTEEPL